LCCRSKIEDATEYPVSRVVFGTAQLEDEMCVADAGIESESTVSAFVDAEGGKRKRKKKGKIGWKSKGR
jgi:phosphoribosylformimino-5-aminoimidazole carboxamide ribonucleotide (ProFAR) isomerase